MPQDPRKIAESRKNERQVNDWEMRQTLALEHIADTLEALRIEFVLYSTDPTRRGK